MAFEDVVDELQWRRGGFAAADGRRLIVVPALGVPCGEKLLQIVPSFLVLAQQLVDLGFRRRGLILILRS